MKRIFLPAGVLVVLILAGVALWRSRQPPASAYTGAGACRECHAEFYQRWSNSWHGLAMQPYSAALAGHLPSLTNAITISNQQYRVEITPQTGTIIEQGPTGQHRYPIRYATGGKNTYFLLTELDRGQLQVLPLAFDTRRQEWYDMAGSALRHFQDVTDRPFHWRDRVFIFNTACYNCHVSQLDQNYDPHTDTYRTSWAEPGINCETCHGPGRAHVELFRKLPAGAPPPTNIQIVATKEFTREQMNSSCAPCHAKMTPITKGFPPGALFLDHFDFSTLEDRDWYPDGRDLGENFTETTWRISPCLSGGQFDCNQCHTPSGRDRFPGPLADQACLPCHQPEVDHAAEHSHHPAGSVASRCVSCHMPVTEFARMRRSDHSMRAPNPAATIEFGSPNACNLCHTNQSPQWAADWVARWHPGWSSKEYELRRARLIAAARRQDWSQLPAMLEFITNDAKNEVFAAGLIRLLRSCPDDRLAPALRQALCANSALVRARAAEALAGHRDPATIAALTEATGDRVRLVRVRAAESLAGYPPELLPPLRLAPVRAATDELLTALTARPDDAMSHYNLGNYHLACGAPDRAAAAFETALRMQPDSVLALVNSSLAYNALGSNQLAEVNLRRAQDFEPSNAVVNLNFGLLLAELGKLADAETAFRRSWQADTNNAVAAYNLGVLLATKSPDESLQWCRRAMVTAPHEPKYAYTVAFFERQQSHVAEAIRILQEVVQRHPTHTDSIELLGQIYFDQGDGRRATEIFQQAAGNPAFPADARAHFARRVIEVSQPGRD